MTKDNRLHGRERVVAILIGRPVDWLPCMPITMMFAADCLGVPYRDYATDYRQLVAGQMRVAEEFEFDYVNAMSDPACEAADCGAPVKFFPDQPPALDDSNPLLADKARLLKLPLPDPATGPPAPPASPPTLAGVLKTQGNRVENSTNRVSASART
jgi:hypothetical protein